MTKQTNVAKKRCAWVTADPLYIDYHDKEWGKPVYDDKTLFEFLILEGAQAGLNWLTILKRRQSYSSAFDHFDPKKIVRYNERKIASLLLDEGIIRNKLKIAATIQNARCYLEVLEEYDSFSDYMWQFVDGRPINNHWASLKQVPSTTTQSDHMSKTLKKRGFKFVGSTICYAYMQAVGMVNDHTTDCFCYKR